MRDNVYDPLSPEDELKLKTENLLTDFFKVSKKFLDKGDLKNCEEKDLKVMIMAASSFLAYFLAPQHEDTINFLLGDIKAHIFRLREMNKKEMV